MPRPSTRSTRSINNPPSSSPPPPQLPAPEDEAYLANLTLLRRNWKWVVFSQFYFTFAPLFAMHEVPISAIEDDLARSTRMHIPRVMYRLLYALTQDRKITIDNWQSSLRRQYARRDPSSNPIGFEPKKVNQRYILEAEDLQQSASVSVEPEQAHSRALLEDETGLHLKAEPDDDSPPVADLTQDLEASELSDWHDLPMLSKLDSMNLLIEWMFHNPHRIRSIMRDDDETAQWRIEPIGYDVKRTAYWFIGADRLWIQRSTHQPRSLKRKRFPKQPTKENHKPAGKRRKVRRDDSSDSSSNLPDPQPREIAISGPRAAKLKANKKLDAQARALAKFQRENALVIRSMRTTRRAGSVKDPGSSHPRVMRASGRLRRGKPDPDDEWESIPDGWMTEDNSGPSPRISTRTTKLRRMSPETTDLESDHEDPKPIKTGLESDESVSDLTDLSSDHEDSVSTDVNGGWNKCDSDTLTDGKQDDAMPNHNLAEFIEWEMICSTLSEWENIAERFENATHYSEKALHKLLKNHIVPTVVADLREIDRKKQEAERKRLLEEAVVHRKRSSRIAMKESEKEEARLLSLRKAGEAEKVSRAKRLEMRQQREAAERGRKEREQRRRDHGLRTRTGPGARQHEPREKPVTRASHVSSARQGDWELSCEVCLKRTRNQDDGVPIMSCGSCNIWQHIPCHEGRDRSDGRPPRDWEKEEFYCSRCSSGPSANGHGASNALPFYTSHQTKMQLRWDHGRSGAKPPGPTQSPYTALSVPERHDYYQMPPVPGMTNGGYSHHVYNGNLPSLPTSVDQYSNISFSHYQPHQRGFTSKHSQPSVHNSSHYPNAHLPHSLPTHNTSPMYPTYTNGVGDPTSQGHHGQPGYGGHYRTSTSALPLQNGMCTSQSWSLSPPNVSGVAHVASPHAYETGYDPRLYEPSNQALQSQYVPVIGSDLQSRDMAGKPEGMR